MRLPSSNTDNSKRAFGKKTLLLFAFALSIVIVTALFTRCTRCSTQHHHARGAMMGTCETNIVDDYIEESSSYQAGSLSVPAGTCMQEAMWNRNPQLKNIEQKHGLGGSKLIGEMSADAAGIYTSRPGQFTTVPIGTLTELKLCPPQDPNNIVKGIIRKEFTVLIKPIETCGLRDAISEIFDGNLFASLRMIIVVTNNTHICQKAVIERGQMIEIEKEDVQNLVVCSREMISIPAGETATLIVKCMCAAQFRQSPVGSRAKLTPFILNAPPSVFEKQKSVWDYLNSIRIDSSPHTSSLSTVKRSAPSTEYITSQSSSRNTRGHRNTKRNTRDTRVRKKKNTMVFYAWGAGQQIPEGKSMFGHAFVDIPTIGPVGFSGGRGVFDHSDYVQNATYSCAIAISDEQLDRVMAKYLEWKNNPPKYKLARTDCTTFTLDIADAAGIKYGPRITIQAPVTFLKRLKKYNRKY